MVSAEITAEDFVVFLKSAHERCDRDLSKFQEAVWLNLIKKSNVEFSQVIEVLSGELDECVLPRPMIVIKKTMEFAHDKT